MAEPTLEERVSMLEAELQELRRDVLENIAEIRALILGKARQPDPLLQHIRETAEALTDADLRELDEL